MPDHGNFNSVQPHLKTNFVALSYAQTKTYFFCSVQITFYSRISWSFGDESLYDYQLSTKTALLTKEKYEV